MIKNFKNLKKACDIEIQEIVQKIKDNTTGRFCTQCVQGLVTKKSMQ